MKTEDIQYINWHRILNKDWNNYLVICWNCWSYIKKTRSKLYQNKWCIYCTNRNTKTNLKIRCWLLWLYYPTILSRINRWWDITAALYQDKNWKQLWEILSQKDLIYLNKFYEKNYNEDKEIAGKARNKYLLNRFKYEI